VEQRNDGWFVSCVEAMKRCFAWLRRESVERNGNVGVLFIWVVLSEGKARFI